MSNRAAYIAEYWLASPAAILCFVTITSLTETLPVAVNLVIKLARHFIIILI
jgi:hypothetical protein